MASHYTRAEIYRTFVEASQGTTPNPYHLWIELPEDEAVIDQLLIMKDGRTFAQANTKAQAAHV